MEKGQINRNSTLGEAIFYLACGNDVITIVDIGTFNGLGSTKCILDAVLVSHDKKNVFSIECDKKRYVDSKNNLGSLPDNFNILWGSIISPQELIPPVDVLLDKTLRSWYKVDLKNIKDAPNIINEMPEKIDLLIIDGGEFSGYTEFKKLYQRCKYIVLDDTKTFKNKKTREFILNNKDKITIIDDNLYERNGFLICKINKNA